jgi:hypothetical protein
LVCLVGPRHELFELFYIPLLTLAAFRNRPAALSLFVAARHLVSLRRALPENQISKFSGELIEFERTGPLTAFSACCWKWTKYTVAQANKEVPARVSFACRDIAIESPVEVQSQIYRLKTSAIDRACFVRVEGQNHQLSYFR